MAMYFGDEEYLACSACGSNEFIMHEIRGFQKDGDGLRYTEVRRIKLECANCGRTFGDKPANKVMPMLGG